MIELNLEEKRPFLHSYKIQYKYNQPFPHLVIDGFFDDFQLLNVALNIPGPEHGHWWKYENTLERKLARNDVHHFDHSIQWLIYKLQSHEFVSFLEEITCIDGLIVDHTLNGGGIHQIVRGGKLDVHADYNYHPITRLDRRLNVLVYLNPGWKPEWKGSLELWNREMTKCEVSIQPLFNRMVIFGTNDTAWHGHPDPLECPENQTRKSIALYYYTNGRPVHERSEPHSTIFKRRPQDPILEEEEELRRQRAIRRLT